MRRVYWWLCAAGAAVILFSGCGGGLGVPVLKVTVGDTVIAGSSASYDFGTVAIGSGGATVTFTVENVGEATLALTGTETVVITGSAAFGLTGAAPDPTIAPGESTQFSVHFDPATEGSLSATVTIDTNVVGLGEFSFTATGTGTATSATVTLHITNLPSQLSLSSVAASVSGAGMATLDGSFAASSADLELVVPTGVARSFSVQATVAAADPNAVRAYTASAVADVTADGQIVNLTLDISQTRILIPDNLNYRLVQIDDFTGAGWTDLTDSELDLVEDFQPSDVDLDIEGRIYVATHIGYMTGGIVRIDNMSDTTPEALLGNGVTAIAIDRSRGYLYYIVDLSDFWLLRRIDLANIEAGSTDVDTGGEIVSSLFGVWGLAVDPDGVLYIPDPNNPLVTVFDPSRPEGSRVLGTIDVPNDEIAFDVAVQSGALYISSIGPQVARVELSTGDPSSIGGFPEEPGSPLPGELYGPWRFVSHAGSTIMVTDEDVGVHDRLVGFDDMSGSGWATFGSTGTGAEEFQLFEYMVVE